MSSTTRRSISNCSLSLGLVNAPVRVYSGTGDNDVSFKKCGPAGEEVEQVYRIKDTDEIITNGECERSYNGKLIDQATIATINEECKEEDGLDLSDLHIQKFVPLKTISFYRVTNHYFIAPDRGGHAAFATIIKTMAKKKVAGVCKWTLRNRQKPIVLYVEDGILHGVTLAFASDLRETPEEYADLADIKVNTGHQKVLEQIIDATYDEGGRILDALSDTAVPKRLALIEKAQDGDDIKSKTKAAQKPAGDLMAALEASLAQVREGAAAKAA